MLLRILFPLTSVGVLIGGLVFPTPSHYYVAASGSDSNPGTISQPWQTISKINAHTFIPGDTLSLNGGDTFSGSILATISGTPDAAHKFVLNSYGSGKPIISCGNSYGVRIVNKPYVEVRGIKVVGSGIIYTGVYPDQTADTTSTNGGVELISDTDSTAYPGQVVDGNEVTGTRQGIYIANTNYSATIATTGAVVNANYVHDCSNQGIWMTGAWATGDLSTTNVHRDAVVTGNRFENIPGLTPSQYELGGFAVRFTNCDNTTFSGNLLKRSGWASSSLPVAMLLVYVNHTLVSHNEVCEFSTHAGDGKGIDPDIGALNTIVEYNYVHDSDKAGLFNFGGINTTFRYNVVERCNQCLIGAAGPQTIYQNTFINTTSSNVVDVGLATCAIYNNVIVGQSGVPLIKITPGGASSVIGNNYQTLGGSTLIFDVLFGSTYTGIAAFRAAGYEKLSGVDKGVVGDPLLSDAGNGTQQLPTNPVSALAAYDLGVGSAAIGAGIDLSAVGITAPTTDWHGNASYVDTRDAGAVRSGSHAP